MLIQKELEITIDGKGLYNITEIINQAIAKHRIAKGLCTLFIKHTSASLIIQENADPNVLKDIIDFFDRVVPESENYAHKEEGPDDMPAHIKSALTNTSINIVVFNLYCQLQPLILFCLLCAHLLRTTDILPLRLFSKLVLQV